jgi:site-specific recombinase XerC
MRLGELLSLTVDSIDLKRQSSVVDGKTGEGYVPLRNLTTQALWKYLTTRAKFNLSHNALWCDMHKNRLSERGIDGIFRALGKKAGIKLRPTYCDIRELPCF